MNVAADNFSPLHSSAYSLFSSFMKYATKQTPLELTVTDIIN